MSEDQFIKYLTDRHDKIKPALLTDIRSLISGFSEEALDLLKDYYRDNWDAGYMPKRPWFIKASKELGLKKQHIQDMGVICGKCESVYSVNSGGCPKCKSIETLGITDYARGFIRVKHDCWRCKHHDGIKGRDVQFKTAYGPTCETWGVKRTHEYCEGCLCYLCCGYQYKYSQGSYYREHADGDIEPIPMPWLKKNSEKK